MRATVDSDTCTGCELCVQTCPEIFEMTDDGVARAKATDVASEHQECCREAAEGCPVEAISIEE
jgi:ferredoxin